MVIKNAPEYVMRQDVKEHHQKNPKNLFSGVGYGIGSFFKGIGTGLSGIVTEPYKGAKENGVKGATIGVGKGIIGLVAKPIAGTFGLVQYTVQGTINTPSTIKQGVKKAFTATPKKGKTELSPKSLQEIKLEESKSELISDVGTELLRPELTDKEIENFQS